MLGADMRIYLSVLYFLLVELLILILLIISKSWCFISHFILSDIQNFLLFWNFLVLAFIVGGHKESNTGAVAISLWTHPRPIEVILS